MTFLGQTFAHAPHPMHSSRSTVATPFAMRIALTGQARTQEP